MQQASTVGACCLSTARVSDISRYALTIAWHGKCVGRNSVLATFLHDDNTAQGHVSGLHCKSINFRQYMQY